MFKLYVNIKEYRLQRGWSQDELARRVGYTDRSSITKIENGQVNLTQSKIAKFAEVFDVSPSVLMGWEDEPQAPQPVACPSADACKGAAHEAVQMLLRLDRDDLLIIQGELRAMLRAEKYQDEPGSAAPA